MGRFVLDISPFPYKAFDQGDGVASLLRDQPRMLTQVDARKSPLTEEDYITILKRKGLFGR